VVGIDSYTGRRQPGQARSELYGLPVKWLGGGHNSGNSCEYIANDEYKWRTMMGDGEAFGRGWSDVDCHEAIVKARASRADLSNSVSRCVGRGGSHLFIFN
jgi:hypothetical protein